MVILESPQLQAIIDQIDRAGSSPELVTAVRCLANLKSASAIPTLIRVLGFNNPTAAVIAMGGLIQLGDRAVPQLLGLMDDYNYGARAYTVRALATIADPRALDCLINCALCDFAPSVRRAAIKGLGQIWRKHPDPQSLEPIVTTLTQVFQDTDWAIRYGAIVALSEISQARPLLEAAVDQEQDRVVKARLYLALSGPARSAS